MTIPFTSFRPARDPIFSLVQSNPSASHPALVVHQNRSCPISEKSQEYGHSMAFEATSMDRSSAFSIGSGSQNQIDENRQ